MLNDYSFLTKSQSAPKATSGIDYSFLTRTTTPKETPKTQDNIVKASDYKKVRLPLSLGGGEYITNDRGDLYLTPRNQETLGGTLPGMERDHIVPVSLGGTSNIQNLQYLESKPSFWQRIGGIFGKETSVQKSPNRQEGKLKVEQKAISGFKSGDLSIGEARLMVAMENMRIQGIIPEKNKETTWGNLGYGVKKALGDVFVKAPVGLAKEMASNIVGSLDFLHRTGLQVVSGVGTFVSPTVVSISKLLGDDQLKNISHDQIWADAIKEGADRMLDIGRPDEFFRAKINNDTYVPMMLFNDEIKALAKSSNEKMEQGDVRGSFADAGKIGAIKFMTDWANPFYAFAIKGVRFDPTKARGKVLWQGTFKQPVNQIGKAKEVQGVLRLETKPQKIVEVIKGRVKKLKEPDIRIWMKTTKDGKISVDVRNVGGDILNKDLLKVVGETTTQPGVTPVMSLPVKLRPTAPVKPIKPVVNPTTIQKLDSLNPTGGVFAKYTPKQRATAELADNITTLDKTMGKSADEMITIYRGSNKGGEIVPGDFITTNKQLAKDYAGTGKVLEKRVKLSDILDDITEPLGEEYIYRPKSTPLKSNLINEAKKYKSAEEFIQTKMAKETDFTDYHQAPRMDKTPVKKRMDDGGDFSLREVANGKTTAPSDFFDEKVGARYYMYDNLEGHQSFTAIDNIIRAEKNGIKDRTITAYRAVPKNVKVDKLQDGDWVSFSKEYAEQHGMRRFDGKYKLIEQEVSPDDVWWDANDINEWGYDTGKGNRRKTVKEREDELRDIWNKANKTNADNPLVEEAKKYKSAEELQKMKKEAEILKQKAQETQSGNDVRAWRNLQNEIESIETDIAKEIGTKRDIQQRKIDETLRQADTTIDKLNKDDLDLLISEAKKTDNLDDFIGKIRGSATQYGEYTPKLRKYVRPESVFMGDIKGLNPNTKITVYRGIDSKSVTGKKIRNGDFVTTDYNDALQYTDSPSKVVSLQTRLKNLVAEYPDEVDISNPLKPVSYELLYNPTGKINKITKSQLTDIWNKANKPKTSITPKQSVKKPSTISETAFSKHYERVKSQYGFQDNVEFTRKTELTEKKKAFDFIQRSPEKALRIGYGYDEVPKGINQQVFRASLVASLNARGKTALAQEVAKIQSSKMTEAAQTLAFGRLDIGTEAGIIKNITQARLEKIGKGLGVKEPEKRVEQARQVIERQAKDASKKVSELQKGKNTAKQLKEIDDLISSIIC